MYVMKQFPTDLIRDCLDLFSFFTNETYKNYAIRRLLLYDFVNREMVRNHLRLFIDTNYELLCYDFDWLFYNLTYLYQSEYIR